MHYTKPYSHKKEFLLNKRTFLVLTVLALAVMLMAACCPGDPATDRSRAGCHDGACRRASYGTRAPADRGRACLRPSRLRPPPPTPVRPSLPPLRDSAPWRT